METLGQQWQNFYCCSFVSLTWFVRDPERMTTCWKAKGVSWWMEPLGRFLRLPREHIEGPPRGFLKAYPWPHPRTDPRPQARGPSICSLGSPLSTLRNLPKGSIHHNTPSAFPQIVQFYYLLKQRSGNLVPNPILKKIKICLVLDRQKWYSILIKCIHSTHNLILYPPYTPSITLDSALFIRAHSLS